MRRTIRAMAADCDELQLEERLEGATGRWADVRIDAVASTVKMVLDVRNHHAPSDAWHHAATFELEIAVAHPAACTVNGRWCSWWDLESGAYGPLGDAHVWLMRQLWDDGLAEIDGVWQFDGYLDDPRRHAVWLRFSELCEHVATRLTRRWVSTARETALQLPGAISFFVYACLLADESGRIRQMIDVCPGLLTLASIDPLTSRSRELIDGIRRGLRLSALIASALSIANEDYYIGPARPLSRCATALLRHAPPMSPEDLVYMLHAPGVDVNDLARCQDSTLWFRVMARWGCRAGMVANRDRAADVGGFISRNGSVCPNELVDWLVHSRASPPKRHTALHHVQRQIDAWHADVGRGLSHAPQTPLAIGPVPCEPIPEIEAAPIETVGDLAKEGHQMRNCVAAFADAAIAGELLFYRATIDRARITIAVDGSPHRWSLREASGFANRQLEPREHEIVRRWVAALI